MSYRKLPARARSLSRREFGQLSAATAAGAMMLPGLARAQTPKSGGHFRYGLTGGGNTGASPDPAT